MTISQFPPAESGIPSGATADRPASPAIGDLFYNGTLTILEIYSGTAWVPCSASPGTPTIATPTDAATGDAWTATAGKLSVAFTPATNGGAVLQYNAFTTVGGYSGNSSGTTVTISGLTPGTSYTVFGTAQNSYGTSGNTPNAAAVTATTLPQVRTIGTATTSNTTTDVVVTWTNGDNGGKPLSSITITPFLNGTTAQTSQTAASTSSTSHTFTGLTIGNSYTFKVKATNANGTCADSTASNSVTIPATVFQFNTSGTWTPSSYPATYKAYLIGAGGSAGLSNRGLSGGFATDYGFNSTSIAGGGGGGSGYYAETNLTTVNTGNVTVTVGAGATNSAGGTTTVGAVNAAGGSKGSNGTTVDLNNYTAGAGGAGGSGGGGGGRWQKNSANNQFNIVVEAGGNGGNAGGNGSNSATANGGTGSGNASSPNGAGGVGAGNAASGNTGNYLGILYDGTYYGANKGKGTGSSDNSAADAGVNGYVLLVRNA